MSGELGGKDEANGTLNRRVARGAAWLVGVRVASRMVGVLSTLVLARLLVPADFGLVALATAMIAAVGVFGEFGFEQALVQNQKAGRSHYDTAWTLGLARGLVVSTIIAVAAYPLGNFFDDQRVGNVCLALALVPLLEGFSNIGTVRFLSDLTLDKEFVLRMVPRLVGVVATVALAIVWRSYWALVCGTLLDASLRFVLSYVMQPYRPRFSVAAWRGLMGFSIWMLATNLAAFVNRQADTFAISKMLNAHSVGIFSIAHQLANLASAEIIAPAKRALLPGYAKLAHDIPLLAKAYLDACGILVLIALPVTLGIGLTADRFVPILLGPNWVDSVPLLQILAFSSALRSLNMHVAPVYLALNKPHLGAYAAIGRMVVFLPMLVFGLHEYGIMGAAFAHVIGQTWVLMGSFYLMHRLLGLKIGDFSSACWRPVAASVIMAVVVYAIKWHFPISEAGIAREAVILAMTVLAGAVAFVCSLLSFWWLSGQPAVSAESHILDPLRARLMRRRRKDTAQSDQ